jgi:uncharacterized protein involved in outer membrane biogenesis
MKIFKKILKITGITTVVLLILLISIPFIFGKQIKEAVKNYLNEEVRADVYFEDIGISVFANFPNITVTLDKFGVAGREEFKGDTLLNCEHFGVVVNLFSLFGDKYQVRKITIDEPTIHAKVLADGKANWDIMKPSTDSVPAAEAATDTTPAAPLALELSSYRISGADVIYDDRASDMYLRISNLEHKGSGDFQNDNYDFETSTTADSVTFRMEQTAYLSRAKIDADITVNIDSKNSRYTLKDNRIGVNALELFLEGFVVLVGDDVNMDMKFGTNQNTFKSILSMVPGMYTQDFDAVDTDGNFKLSGLVKGTYNEKRIPGFNVNLAVENGRFKYPDLPEEVKDINFDLKVDCPDGNLDKLKVDFPKFHALFGAAPIDARCMLTGLTSDNMNVDAQIKTNIELANLLKMFPMEGQELRGKFSLDGTAKGTVNMTAGTFPVVNAKMKLENGYYKNADFPSALDKMSLDAEMRNANGSLTETTLNVKQFHTEIDGSPIDAQMDVKDFNDPQYNLKVNGSLDLAKLAKIYPIDGTTMAGMIKANLSTSGRVSDIEAEQYMKLPTAGSIEANNVTYKSVDFPQGVAITKSLVNFSPQRMDIASFSGKLGASPVTITGFLENYLAYIMLPDQQIKGQMALSSSRFNVNEWMVEDEDAAAASAQAAAPEAEVPMTVFEVPKGIDFTFTCNIANVIYDNLNLKDLLGEVVLANQEVRFRNLTFTTLGGNMRMAGGYSTKNPAAPDIDMTMTLVGLDVQQTWKAFEIVKNLAPAAKFLDGKVNSSLNLVGKLKTDMSPDLASITSVGDLVVNQGTLRGFKPMEMISDKIKLAQLKELKLKDTKILYEVKQGRIWVEPFDIVMGNGKMVAKGSHGIDQSMDYDMDFDLPAGVAGAAAMSAVNGLLKNVPGVGAGGANSNLRVAVGLGGTVDKPTIKYVRPGGQGGTQATIEDIKATVKDTVTKVITEKIEDVKTDLKAKAREEADKILKEAQTAADKIKADAKVAADKVRTEANKRADDIEKSAKNPLEKVAKKKAADLVRKEGKEGGDKLEKEATVKADKVMAEARTKSDAKLNAK